MTCACPPTGPYSELACCRWNCEDRCPPDRCQHPELTSREILALVEDTHTMLRTAKAKRDSLRAELNETQSTVEALVAESERLEYLLLAKVRGADIAVEAEDGAPGLSEALRGTVWQPAGGPVANSLPDLG